MAATPSFETPFPYEALAERLSEHEKEHENPGAQQSNTLTGARLRPGTYGAEFLLPLGSASDAARPFVEPETGLIGINGVQNHYLYFWDTGRMDLSDEFFEATQVSASTVADDMLSKFGVVYFMKDLKSPRGLHLSMIEPTTGSEKTAAEELGSTGRVLNAVVCESDANRVTRFVVDIEAAAAAAAETAAASSSEDAVHQKNLHRSVQEYNALPKAMHFPQAIGVTLDADGRKVIVSTDGVNNRVVVFDYETGDTKQFLEPDVGWAWGLALNHNEHVAVIAGDNGTKWMSIGSGDELRHDPGTKGAYGCNLWIDSAGFTLTHASGDNAIRVRSPEDETVASIPIPFKKGLQGFCVDEDRQRLIVCCGDGDVLVFGGGGSLVKSSRKR
jgi:hypothetical protein